MAADQAQLGLYNAQVYPGTCLLLYVDDDNVNQQVLDMLLSSKAEYRVLLACDQQEVEEILEDEPYLPDVVLMDNQLVDCTGLEVIAWMRERYSKSLVFVMCTARSQAEAHKLAAAAKAQGYLCKPYTMKELLLVLSELKVPTLSIGSASGVHESATTQMSKSEASEALQTSNPGMQERTQAFPQPIAPLGSLLRTALQACQSAPLTILRGARSIGARSSDAGRSALASDASCLDGADIPRPAAISDSECTKFGQGYVSSASAHSSSDLSASPSRVAAADPARVSVRRNAATGGSRSDTSSRPWRAAGPLLRAGASQHSNRAATATWPPSLSKRQHPQRAAMLTSRFHGDHVPLVEPTQASYSASWLMPYLPEDLERYPPSIAELTTTAASDVDDSADAPARHATLAGVPKHASCEVLMVSPKVAPGAQRSGTAPADLQLPSRTAAIVHRSSWPRVSVQSAAARQHQDRSHRLRCGLTAGSCTSAPANVMRVSGMGPHSVGSHKQEWLLGCPPASCPPPGVAPSLRLGAMRNLGDLGPAWPHEAVPSSGFGNGSLSAEEDTGYPRWRYGSQGAVSVRMSDMPTHTRRSSTNHGMSEGSWAKDGSHSSKETVAISGERVYIAAACGLGVLASGEAPGLPTTEAPSAERRSGEPLSGADTNAGVPMPAWGPVWVRLCPSPDSSSSLEQVIVVGEQCDKAVAPQATLQPLPVACALSEQALEAELASLRIAPGHQEARDIALSVQRVVALLKLPVAAEHPSAQDSGVADDSLSLDDLLQVLGTWSAREALRGMGLTLSQLKSMSALQMMQHGVMDLTELEALMDALYAL